jgi:hypothetical protein
MGTIMAINPQGIDALGANQMTGMPGIDPKVSAIITHYFQNRRIPLNVGLAAMQKQMQEGLKLIPYKNSVMGLKMLEPHIAQVHFFTTDTERQLDMDIKFFVSKLKQAGVDTIYDSEFDPLMARALQDVGVQVQQSDMPKFKLKATL